MGGICLPTKGEGVQVAGGEGPVREGSSDLYNTREGLYPYEFGVDGMNEDHPNA